MQVRAAVPIFFYPIGWEKKLVAAAAIMADSISIIALSFVLTKAVKEYATENHILFLFLLAKT
jgi:hypothetical protein